MAGQHYWRLMIIVAIPVFITGCDNPFIDWPYPFNRELPEVVLDIPNPDADVDDEYFATRPSDINEAGRIVGFTNDASGPGTASIDDYLRLPVRGFAVDFDGTHHVALNHPDALATWPLAISNGGVVTGAYLSGVGTEYTLNAFVVNDDGTSWSNLHPAGYESSVATHINDNGLVFGHVLNPDTQDAVIFSTMGEAPTMLAPTGFTVSMVEAVSIVQVVVSATLDGGDGARALFLYTIANGNVEELIIPGVPSDRTAVEEIASDGTLVGWHTDLSSAEEFGDWAFTYRLGDSAVRVFDEEITIGDWTYGEYRFLDFTDDGTIVGIAYRTRPGGGLPQARAARFSWDYARFEDITPENNDAYSEAFAINQSGQAIGYAGFPYGNILRRFQGIRDRAFVLLIE